MDEETSPVPPPTRRFAWKTLFLGVVLGIVAGIVGPTILILGSYAFFKKEAVIKMAETKDLKPLVLRADFDWSVTDLDANTVSLKAYQGTPTLLHFWNPSCVSCVAEIPSMNALYDRFQEKGLNFVTIAVHAEEDLAVDVAEHGIRFPVYTVDRATVPTVFDAQATPTTFIVDTHGFVILKHAGAVDWMEGDGPAFVEQLLTP